MKWRRYILNLLIALDQGVNALFGGSPTETMSSRVYRYKDTNKVARLVYQLLDAIQKQHCEMSLKTAEFYQGLEVLK